MGRCGQLQLLDMLGIRPGQLQLLGMLGTRPGQLQLLGMLGKRGLQLQLQRGGAARLEAELAQEVAQQLLELRSRGLGRLTGCSRGPQRLVRHPHRDPCQHSLVLRGLPMHWRLRGVCRLPVGL